MFEDVKKHDGGVLDLPDLKFRELIFIGALKRLDDGSYGRSVRSGVPIPDERLEADPAAELTVEEART